MSNSPAARAGRNSHLRSLACPLALPLAPETGRDWQPFPILHGATPGMRDLSCHVSALNAGHCPHPPHRHDEEELLLVLEGEAEVVLPDLPADRQRQRLRRGDLVYYPAQFAHTLEGVSARPVNYLMLKWLTDPTGASHPLGFERHVFHAPAAEASTGFATRTLFEGPTRWLHKLHCHTSTLAPGASYAPHADGYDVVMIVLEGMLESLAAKLVPHGVYFYPAGAPHGAHNPGDTLARYVVFEFHSTPYTPCQPPPRIPLWRKLVSPRRWRRLFFRVARRLFGRRG